MRNKVLACAAAACLLLTASWAIAGCGESQEAPDTDPATSQATGEPTDVATPEWNGECPITAEQSSEALGVKTVFWDDPPESMHDLYICAFLIDPSDPRYSQPGTNEVTFGFISDDPGSIAAEELEKSCSIDIPGVDVAMKSEWGEGACQISTEENGYSSASFAMGNAAVSLSVLADSLPQAEEGLEYLMGTIFE